MTNIFFLCIEDFKNTDLVQYEKYLRIEEKEIRDKFVFKKDRDQYLLTRMLSRKLIADRLGVKYSTLQFDKNAYGKPFLIGGDMVFNISHTKGLIVLALSDQSRSIGLDIEHIDKDIDVEAVMPVVFEDQEVAAVLDLPKEEQKSRFFEIWTLKESYIKVIGKGFYLSPKSFSFDFIGDKIQFIRDVSEFDLSEIYFELFSFNEIYKLAICQVQTTNKDKIKTFKVSTELDYIEFVLKSEYRSL
jgi:4'-phosphopantetheinyl transferase